MFTHVSLVSVSTFTLLHIWTKKNFSVPTPQLSLAKFWGVEMPKSNDLAYRWGEKREARAARNPSMKDGEFRTNWAELRAKDEAGMKI